ncbi:MAG: hypothetical protein BGO68_00620 [Candidatus Amoebophilus sp. 36-38]|nr:MAG: hypothetical protein BGO68_00620 [Candidatus Amoebophilus sp. 36-38]
MLALIGAFTILGATSKAVEPLSFGAKVGFVNSSIIGLDKAKKSVGNKDSEGNMFNPGFIGSAYVEYAFLDNVGAGLEVGYSGGFVSVASVKAKDDKEGKDTYKINLHRINIFPAVKFYPMGREDENGILKLHVGADLSIPVMAKKKQGDKDAEEIKRDEFAPFGIGAIAGVGYEFPCGLELDLRGSYAFTDVFKENSDFKKNTLGISDSKDKTNLYYGNFSVGYNFAVLLEE